uniref:Uncharacterized protein n=1 Tax=Pithovirus LCPAC403 TaxID=2506596 RepID=A0A481ZAM4_9VIRU|nr:MAG: hypothetical protein LCPAC403_01070 [Pithovirus LCPAC403]
MAVYRILVPGTVGYFTDFEKAKAILKSKHKSDFQNVSLIKANEIGYFNPLDSVNVFESNRSLRKLTSEEINELSELYVTYTPNKSRMYELYLNDYSYLKSEFELGDYDRWNCFFGHLGSIRKTYTLHMMFNYVVGDNYDEESFEETVVYLEEEESKYYYTNIKLNELIERKDMKFMDYLSLQTERKLRLAFDMAKIYLALMKD